MGGQAQSSPSSPMQSAGSGLFSPGYQTQYGRAPTEAQNYAYNTDQAMLGPNGRLIGGGGMNNPQWGQTQGNQPQWGQPQGQNLNWNLPPGFSPGRPPMGQPPMGNNGGDMTSGATDPFYQQQLQGFMQKYGHAPTNAQMEVYSYPGQMGGAQLGAGGRLIGGGGGQMMNQQRQLAANAIPY